MKKLRLLTAQDTYLAGEVRDFDENSAKVLLARGDAEAVEVDENGDLVTADGTKVDPLLNVSSGRNISVQTVVEADPGPQPAVDPDDHRKRELVTLAVERFGAEGLTEDEANRLTKRELADRLNEPSGSGDGSEQPQ